MFGVKSFTESRSELF